MPPELADELDSLLEDDSHDEAEIQEETDRNDGEGQGGDDGEGAQNAEIDQGQARQEDVAPSRSNERVRRATAEAKEAKERAAELERQLTALRQPQSQGPSPADLARMQAEEAARLEMMQPHEQFQYLLNKQQQATMQQMAHFQRQQADQVDRMSFEARQARDPLAKKFASDVERLVTEQGALGFQVKRETALAYAVGQAVLAKASKATAKQRPAAAGRVAGNTVPANRGAGGDTRADRTARGGDDLSAIESRLKGVVF
jgi:hypothetical protein